MGRFTELCSDMGMLGIPGPAGILLALRLRLSQGMGRLGIDIIGFPSRGSIHVSTIKMLVLENIACVTKSFTTLCFDNAEL